MKKSAIALGVVVALGAAWAGTTWYTGKTAEAQFQHQVDQFNNKMASLFGNSGDQMKIDSVQFNRGFFSSDMQYNVIINSAKQNTSYTVPFSGKLYHGPLPLNQITGFNFKPVMFSATMELVKNDETQAWFGKNEENPLQAVVSMSYAKQFQGEVNSEVNTTLDGGDISWKITGNFDVNQQGIGKIETVMPIAKLAPPNNIVKDPKGDIENMQITMSNGKSVLDLQQPPTELSKLIIGSSHGQIGKIQMTGKKNGEDIFLEFSDVDIFLKGKLADSFVDYGFGYKIGGLKIDGDGAKNFSLGELVWNMEFNHLDAKSVNTVFDEISKLEPNSKAPMPKAAEDAFQVIAKNQPQIKIDPLSLTNQGGKMEATLNMVLAPHDNFASALQGNLLQLFKQFNFNVHVDKAALVEFLAMSLQSSDKLSKEEAVKQAPVKVEELLQMARENQLLLEDEKSVKFGLNLEEKGLNYNGRILSDDELKAFMLGALLLQSGAR